MKRHLFLWKVYYETNYFYFLVLFLSVFLLLCPSLKTSADTIVTKRGLCISGYHDSNEPRFYNNISAMNTVFTNMSISSSTYINPYSSSSSVLNMISTTFSSADSNDLNYLYLTGHGSTSSINVGTGSSGVLTYSSLRNTLDNLNGHFIIFIQTCYSGSAIDTGLEQDQENISVEEQIINNFFSSCNTRSGELADTTKYTVFCSSQSTQTSTAYTNYGCATYAWAKGLGYDMRTNSTCSTYADANNDGIVTAIEMNTYTDSALSNYFQLNDVPCYYSKYYFRTIRTLDYPLGNPSSNGYITTQDVLLIRKHIANLITLTNRQQALSDVNGDGNITNADVLLIQKYLAGIDL